MSEYNQIYIGRKTTIYIEYEIIYFETPYNAAVREFMENASRKIYFKYISQLYE